MMVIDGSFGEGGGQILRTSVALSLVTGTPFRIENIRAGRKKPGLMRQHLTAVQAAKHIAAAKVSGDQPGSSQLVFEPAGVRAGEYQFAVGTAGSATLVLQTVLPALLTATSASQLIIEGGTHNPHAPPFEFLERAFLPLIKRMGAQVSVHLDRAGFFPAGGGRVRVAIQPADTWQRLEVTDRGSIRQRRARVLLSRLPRHIGERELQVIQSRLGWADEELEIHELSTSQGPGNIVMLEIAGDHVVEVFTGFGRRGVRAEAVAEEAVQATRRYLDAAVPVGEYLADQLLLPMSLAGGGSFRTMPLSRHSITNIAVIKKFLDLEIESNESTEHGWLVSVNQPPH